MEDGFDDGPENREQDPLTPLNIKKKAKNPTAVALKEGNEAGEVPKIAAAGRGKIAEEILQLAYENGINVREDSALAEMLARIELDSPIPSEAFLAVAEILSYVYRANGEPNPFDAVMKDARVRPHTNDMTCENRAADQGGKADEPERRN